MTEANYASMVYGQHVYRSALHDRMKSVGDAIARNRDRTAMGAILGMKRFDYSEEERGILDALLNDPDDTVAGLALADLLEEKGRVSEAETVRRVAGTARMLMEDEQ